MKIIEKSLIFLCFPKEECPHGYGIAALFSKAMTEGLKLIIFTYKWGGCVKPVEK